MRIPFTALALAAVLALAGCGSSSTVSSGGHTSGGSGGSTGTPTGGSSGTSGSHGSTGSTGGTSGTSGGFDGGVGCGLRTCASANANCGPIGDGCGAVIYCGDCPSGEYCGGGGASRCGATACQPTTCAAAGAQCGVISDGCGGTLDCGNPCGAGQYCGGGGPNQCGSGTLSDGGSAVCHPRTCADVGATCGPVADGCGGLTADCGSCNSPDICGGSGIPNQCGSANRPDSGLSCTNLCLQQQSCSGGATTSISGKVFAPNAVDPLYNALVYVPNAPVQAFTQGVACLTCESQISGQPLVATNTGPDGSFTLTNMPVGQNIPVVIQLGRWRRQLTVNTTGCQNTAIPDGTFRLPRNHLEGDIPLTAMVTGSVDALECVLRKIGIDDSEFTDPGGGGRIQFYLAPTEPGGQGPGAARDSSTPDGTQLVGNSGTINQYDMVLFSCEGNQYDKDPSHLANVLSYANAGGRVFATHFSYTWLYSAATWQAAAQWAPNSGSGASETGQLDVSFPKGQAFSSWLGGVGALTGPNQININQWRWDVNAVNPPTQQWIYLPNQSNAVEHLTFNTPWGVPASQQCGRVLFSDFHVTNASTSPSVYFPSECQSGPLTAQEHVLEFMLFDLASCITPDQPPPPTCTPLDCASAGAQCGLIGDGCGGTKDCGSCASGQVCGAGGPSQCGVPQCTPMTCQQQGIVCGQAGDGCGGTISCNSCGAGELCGGAGVPNQCGTPPCTPTTCSAAGAQCGAIGDGCGGILDCGTCPSGQTCGLGGANICGSFQ